MALTAGFWWFVQARFTPKRPPTWTATQNSWKSCDTAPSQVTVILQDLTITNVGLVATFLATNQSQHTVRLSEFSFSSLLVRASFQDNAGTLVHLVGKPSMLVEPAPLTVDYARLLQPGQTGAFTATCPIEKGAGSLLTPTIHVTLRGTVSMADVGFKSITDLSVCDEGDMVQQPASRP
jgi:hypothetical protein